MAVQAAHDSGSKAADDTEDPFELNRVAAWVIKHGFSRVALQIPDSLLPQAPKAASRLRKLLPEAVRVFVLGDCSYGSSSVDEVAAAHYGADCLVHVGPSDQQHNGALPVLFVFGRAPLTSEDVAERVASALREVANEEGAPTSLALVCDVELQHAAPAVASSLEAALSSVRSGSAAGNSDVEARVLLSVPAAEATSLEGSCVRFNDWRFGALRTDAWWAAPFGPLAAAAAAIPNPLRLCGRTVQVWRGKTPEPLLETHPLRTLPTRCGIILCSTVSGSPLERRALLRFGGTRFVWRLDPETGEVARLSSTKMLLQRHRFVEEVKRAGVVGLVLAATGSRHQEAVADRLEMLLQRAGRRTYRFVVGRLTPEKLGNFPDVELFVSLASVENFPWHAKEFMVPIASPYEVEVGLGARAWTGDYITDLEELLQDSAPASCTPIDDHEAVQTLGSQGRIVQFGESRTYQVASVAPEVDHTPAPAILEDGLDGVAQRYTYTDIHGTKSEA
eukprot:TRINITY_DN71628_c0_g1_i1.p1 TRINITY_DN71628_c0_g1~~TRINITY_DN71628_c0_g1_i1.p1  ORF type:complete len:532 (+),score=96.72 TRINITY_DN71628_c0_g1_i1:82-1596(+)